MSATLKPAANSNSALALKNLNIPGRYIQPHIELAQQVINERELILVEPPRVSAMEWLDGQDPGPQDYLVLLLPIGGDTDTITGANAALAEKELDARLDKDNFDVAFTFGHDADAN